MRKSTRHVVATVAERDREREEREREELLRTIKSAGAPASFVTLARKRCREHPTRTDGALRRAHDDLRGRWDVLLPTPDLGAVTRRERELDGLRENTAEGARDVRHHYFQRRPPAGAAKRRARGEHVHGGQLAEVANALHALKAAVAAARAFPRHEYGQRPEYETPVKVAEGTFSDSFQAKLDAFARDLDAEIESADRGVEAFARNQEALAERFGRGGPLIAWSDNEPYPAGNPHDLTIRWLVHVHGNIIATVGLTAARADATVADLLTAWTGEDWNGERVRGMRKARKPARKSGQKRKTLPRPKT